MQDSKSFSHDGIGDLRPDVISGIIALFLAIFLSFSLFPLSTMADAATLPQDRFTLQIDVGFGSLTRLGYWLPVYVTVGNSGGDFRGSVAAHAFSGTPGGINRGTPGGSNGSNMLVSAQQFAAPLTVPRGGQAKVTLQVHFDAATFNPHGVIVDVLDSQGKSVISQQQSVYILNPGDLSVGILSDQQTAFNTLSSVSLPNRANSIYVTPLDASTFPTASAVLQNMEVIILDNFAINTLKPEQMIALQTWVNQGGVLIEAGGPNWQRTLRSLPPELLPVTVQSTDALPPGTRLSLPGVATPVTSQQTSDDALKAPLPISIAKPRPQTDATAFVNETVLKINNAPVLIQARQGQGTVCYLAFDLADPAFTGWSGQSNFWSHLLMRTLGDQLLVSTASPRYQSGPGGLTTRSGILSMLRPSIGFVPLIIGLLIFGYLAILGPIRLLIVRRMKQLQRPYWSWRIVLIAVVVFSLLSYTIAFYQHGASLIDNSISVIQLNADGSTNTSAHMTTYMGVFVPNPGNFQVHLPGGSLPQPLSNTEFSTGVSVVLSDSSTPVSYGIDGPTVNILDAGLWTVHSLVFEQDRQIRGRLIPHLELRGQRLVGTITNTLDAALNDVYVLMPHSTVYIGYLPAGATSQVDFPLQTRPGTMLADQIAQNNGLPSSYFPYAHNGQPQNDLQRHIAQLAMLSGAGSSFIPCDGPCSSRAIINVNKGELITLPPGTPKIGLSSGSDPLLLDGAPATLVGWADLPLDAVNTITINGTTPNGFHENLVQMPLNINITASANLPPDLITGQPIDEQGFDTEMILPGIYTMSTGSISFEFVLPASASASSKGFTITAPNTLNVASPPSSGVSVVQASLYNWQTGSWDAFTLDRYKLTTTNTTAYIGADGRVLLQLANQNASQGLAYLSKPSLTL